MYLLNIYYNYVLHILLVYMYVCIYLYLYLSIFTYIYEKVRHNLLLALFLWKILTNTLVILQHPNSKLLSSQVCLPFPIGQRVTFPPAHPGLTFFFAFI